LAIHLRERAKIAKIADQYLEAHGEHVQPRSREPVVLSESDKAENTQINPTVLRCLRCNIQGHKAVNCPTAEGHSVCACPTSFGIKE